MSSLQENLCPHCGVSLDVGLVDGLCARCLSALPFTTDTAVVREAREATAEFSRADLEDSFPQLEILELLGRGGMGIVYKARQKELDRLVALKLLPPALVADPRFAARFRREAQALAALAHPHIVVIHDFGYVNGMYFLLMEYVDGVNLRQAMNAGRFSPQQALAIVPPVCEALQYAHDHGIVHRDIKPENLLLDKRGHVKIADFGIAKLLSQDAAHSTVDDSQLAGTPQYMAPEQRRPGPTDHRADIYSLGVVLYEMLTGELPTTRWQPPSRRVQIDVGIDEVVLRALEQKPELRFATAAEFRDTVTAVAEREAARAAAGSPVAPPTGGKRSIKSGNAILVAPAEIAGAWGQVFCYRTRGVLMLDETTLSHSWSGGMTTIPLSAIYDLSIGTLPRTMNLSGLSVISVMYTDAGQKRQVLVSPLKGRFRFAEAGVAEWFAAVRSAVVAATGCPPASTPSAQVGIPRSSPLLLILVAMLLASPAWLLWGWAGFVLVDKANRTSDFPGHQSARPAGFPASAHVSRRHHSVFVTHDRAARVLQYVLYYAGDFSTSSAGTQNVAANSWRDEGMIKLRNGRTFAYRREALAPEKLAINGRTYDLRTGRVIVLRDDGVSEQLRLFPPLVAARDPEVMSNLVAAESSQSPDGAEILCTITRTEVRFAAHELVVYLRRDGATSKNLGVETSLHFVAGNSADPAKRMPKTGRWTARHRSLSRVPDEEIALVIALPEELPLESLHAAAAEIMGGSPNDASRHIVRQQRALRKNSPNLFAAFAHPDGWACHLYLTAVPLDDAGNRLVESDDSDARAADAELPPSTSASSSESLVLKTYDFRFAFIGEGRNERLRADIRTLIEQFVQKVDGETGRTPDIVVHAASRTLVVNAPPPQQEVIAKLIAAAKQLAETPVPGEERP